MTTSEEMNNKAGELVRLLGSIQQAIDVQTKLMDNGDDFDASILGKAAHDRALIAKQLADLLAAEAGRR